MKRTIVNIAAVLTALIVGLTINNACAEKIDSENPEEAPMTVRFFVEDGLLFGPDGKVYNKFSLSFGKERRCVEKGQNLFANLCEKTVARRDFICYNKKNKSKSLAENSQAFFKIFLNF